MQITKLSKRRFVKDDLIGERAEWWVSNIIPKKTKKFEFEKNFMTILFAIKNNPYRQILSIVGVSVGVLRRK